MPGTATERTRYNQLRHGPRPSQRRWPTLHFLMARARHGNLPKSSPRWFPCMKLYITSVNSLRDQSCTRLILQGNGLESYSSTDFGGAVSAKLEALLDASRDRHPQVRDAIDTRCTHANSTFHRQPCNDEKNLHPHASKRQDFYPASND